jgi:hypothetical protein
MIHIATIHWRNDVWIDLQARMFAQYITVPFRVYGYLTDIDKKHYDKFYHVLDTGDPGHAEKLIILASAILEDAHDDDWIIFTDGDAFPVSPVVPKVTEYFRNAPLVAIQRLENLGEKHAHPSFCVTTIAFWKRISGDWSKGYQWINALNLAETDVGGELLRALTVNNINWRPLHRSNSKDIISVCFGIYDDLIYHHGAGFRGKEVRAILYERGVFDLYRRWDVRLLNHLVPQRRLGHWRNSKWHPEGRRKRRILQEIAAVDRKVKEKLFADADGFIHALRQGISKF